MNTKGKDMRKIFLAGVLCLFLAMFLSACEKEKMGSVHPIEEKPVSTDYLEENKVRFPYFGLQKSGHFILPTPGSVTPVDPITYRKAVAIGDEDGFEFWVNGSWETYSHKLELYRVRDGEKIWEQSYFNLKLSLSELPQYELHVLRIVLSNNETEIYYDFPFFYQERSKYGEKITNLIREIVDWRDPQEKPMGEVALTVTDVGIDGSIRGTAKDVVAIRREGGFEYLDKMYDFEITADGNNNLKSRIKNKKRGNYDKIRKSVVLSADGEWYENERYYVQLGESEVYAGDTQNVYSLYRRDAIDNDYLIDELSHLRFRSIGWKNGKYFFIGYGVFSEEIPKLNGYRGIAFFEWNGSELQIPYFTEIQEADIEDYLDRHLAIDEKGARVFWIRQGSYYSLDLGNHSLYQSEIPLQSVFDKDMGAFYWQAEEGKDNQSVLWSSMKAENVHALYYRDRFQKIVGTGRGHIYVGEYQITDTLEYLNRKVIYPLQRLVVYQLDGAMVRELVPPAGKFFGLPDFSEKDKGVMPILEKKYGNQTHRGEIRVDYMEVGKQEFDYRVKEDFEESGKTFFMTEVFGVQKDFYNSGLRIVSGAPAKLIYTDTQTARLNWREEMTESHYRIKAGKENLLADSLQDALLQAKGYPQYRILYYDAGKETLLYDSEWKKEENHIPNFTTAKQFPELPRGCEVTSLSMLLQYYDPELPGRFELADELTEYSQQVTGGEVAYRTDMKVAFAGSMYNAKEPGLGVYIEPISIIARRHLGAKVQNVTGISMTQLLTFVSNGQPVQIIISDMVDVVPESLKTTWKTGNGYMEITYREHSVVVVGFDPIYVYYADPLTGRIEKSLHKNFEAGFETFGRQALIILE